MARSTRRAICFWAAVLLFCVACDDSAREPAAAPPIAGAVLDQIQKNVQEILDRDFGGMRAERVRVEKAANGARAVVHATLGAALAEADDQRLCSALSDAASSMLLEGQSIEVHFLRDGAVVHSCGLR